MEPLQLFSLSLDIILVIAAVTAFLMRPRIGGQLAKGMRTLLIGLMILGLAHFIETGLFVIFNLDTQINEIVHRVLIVVAFVFVILGFNTMRRAFDE
jgi:hypothetical protein